MHMDSREKVFLKMMRPRKADSTTPHESLALEMLIIQGQKQVLVCMVQCLGVIRTMPLF